MKVLVFLAFALQEDQERAQEVEWQAQLADRVVPPEIPDEVYFDWGGWFRPQYLQIAIPNGDDIRRQDYDARLWVDFRVGGRHSFYTRARALHRELDVDGEKDVKRKVELDVGHYQFDFRRANEVGGEDSVGFLRLGRVYYRLGTGLAYNARGDGGVAEWATGPVRVGAFAFHSVFDTRDLDLSRPKGDRESRRFFLGALAEGSFSSSVIPYAFALSQTDLNPEPPDPFQDFRWDSVDWGFGLRLSRIVGGLSASSEFVIQGGNRFADGPPASPEAGRERLSGYAAITEVSYACPDCLALNVYFQWMFATGDPDRELVGPTEPGNDPGTDDEAFTGFGFVRTGYLLNPILGNLQIYHLGATLTPWPADLPFEVFEINAGIDGYVYRKQRQRGGISVPGYGEPSRDVGWEVDVFLNFVIASDLEFQVRYAYFVPGDAATDDDPLQFILVFATIFY